MTDSHFGERLAFTNVDAADEYSQRPSEHPQSRGKQKAVKVLRDFGEQSVLRLIPNRAGFAQVLDQLVEERKRCLTQP